jgi:hypothetical protein
MKKMLSVIGARRMLGKEIATFVLDGERGSDDF